MTLRTASARPGLAAALAASLADEKQSTADRFAKAERLHQLAAADAVITPEQLAKPAAPARCKAGTRAGGQSRRAA